MIIDKCMLYSGNNPIKNEVKQASGQFIELQGERFYEIRHYDAMLPFFISLASDTDLWMYLSSTGGLTAGRQSPEQALFPYYTDDKITEQYEQTGPKTILRVTDAGKTFLWEPFSDRQAGVYETVRKISKSTVGNKIIFCEENLSLGLRFSYIWAPAEVHGWVRRATLENMSDHALQVELLDGLQNVLPAGVERKTQNEFSTLVDGYKKTELLLVDNAEHRAAVGLVLFRMEAILVDRAEPSESLRCNTVYTLGLPGADYLLSSRQLDIFRRGQSVTPENEAKGVRGAVFAHTTMQLSADSARTWYFVADVQQDVVKVHDLLRFAAQANATSLIEDAIRQSTETLRQIVAQNDGVQQTADEYNDARHFANTLFNTMRGGYYLDDYNIGGEAFMTHVRTFNIAVFRRHEAFLRALPASLNRADLKQRIAGLNDPQLMRLFMEYLPITFGRRHGDPSRPWNLFNIRVRDDKGKPIVSYQGNWRDIFQNWEALSFSYPGFINGIIAKFLNATTPDGYNPYKVTSEGIDWEVIEPENPWSNIGYWGDHQIIYLTKLLELSYHHDPKALREMLNKRIFAYANVPYRFKSYKEIVADPKNTIRFDDNLHKQIFALIPDYGQDARLVLDENGEVRLTTMADKLLITLLAKFSNFIPEAGIWMNSLRPEWNDANNALVGFGASMVTLCYMLRYVAFLQKVAETDGQNIIVAQETADFFYEISDIIRRLFYKKYEWKISDHARLEITDAFGQAGERYREKVYNGLSGKQVELPNKDLLDGLFQMGEMMCLSIAANRREDGLYHSYNTVHFTKAGISVQHLYEMLEGQVAVISSGILGAEETADLLDAMHRSALYREDQRSYMLYPARRRKTFLELNNIPEEAKALPVVKKYLGTILKQDADGGIHFDASYRNADRLPDELKDLYEQVFNHRAFTGRSGTFYKYEGLGCIYWHMVSKLLLAVGEMILSDKPAGKPEDRERLKKHYNAIREGLGSHKQPAEYGAFPFDAYSHTPTMAGVQQPGMTGQVKEDIINRFFELGVKVSDGQIMFRPQMITDKDFINGELHFTYCHVPVTYKLGQEKCMLVETNDESNAAMKIMGNVLSPILSQYVFERNGFVKHITVII